MTELITISSREEKYKDRVSLFLSSETEKEGSPTDAEGLPEADAPSVVAGGVLVQEAKMPVTIRSARIRVSTLFKT